jgi:hypothetical protein
MLYVGGEAEGARADSGKEAGWQGRPKSPPSKSVLDDDCRTIPRLWCLDEDVVKNVSVSQKVVWIFLVKNLHSS